MLRTSEAGFVRYNGISPLLDQFYGAVLYGGQIMLSTTIGNTTSTRISTFFGEIYTIFQVCLFCCFSNKTKFDLFSCHFTGKKTAKQRNGKTKHLF